MNPLHIDFSTPQPHRNRLQWFVGGASALMLVVLSAIWLLPPLAEASSPGKPGPVARPMQPDLAEDEAIDTAIRRLNFPLGDVFVALEDLFQAPGDGFLSRVEVDPATLAVRISGEAADIATALRLPAHLRKHPGVGRAVLLEQVPLSSSASQAVGFTLELQMLEMP